jgi:hypothetical protein
MWRGFAFDPGARGVLEHSMLQLGEWARRHGPVAVDPRSNNRGRVPPQGAHSPRARQSLARGGVQPSSGAEFRPRGRPALERGGVSPEGASGPRARRSFGVTASGPLSEAEFCPRGAGVGCLLGRRCHPGRSCSGCNWLLVSSFAFLLFCEEMGFP